jgi:hypothetical protein
MSRVEFTATECGSEAGMAGVSCSAESADAHYIVFGHQMDEQHPENSGIYFEFDDQGRGRVNCVAGVSVTDGAVEFDLKNGHSIVVHRGAVGSSWAQFLRSVRETFPAGLVRLAEKQAA